MTTSNHPNPRFNQHQPAPGAPSGDIFVAHRGTDISQWILREKNGTCELHEVLSGFLHSNSEKAFIEDAQHSPNLFIVRHRRDLSKSIVKAYSPKAKVCFCYYMGEKCHNPNCYYLHLCAMKLKQNKCTCVCTNIKECMGLDRNIKRLQSFCLPGFSEKEMLLLVKNSLPTVCLAHNTTSGCANAQEYEFCPYVHICDKFVLGGCNDCLCPKGHSLDSSPGNITLIEKFGHHFNSHNYKRNLTRSLFVPDLEYIILTALIWSGQSGLSLKQLANATKFDENTVLHKLPEMSSKIQTDAIQIFVRMNQFQTCFFYHKPGGCKFENCAMFHVCQKYIADLPHETPCLLSHDVNGNAATQLFQEKLGINLSLEQRLQLLKLSTPSWFDKDYQESKTNDKAPPQKTQINVTQVLLSVHPTEAVGCRLGCNCSPTCIIL